MGPVVMVTSCPAPAPGSAVKQPSLQENSEWAELEAWQPAPALGRWPTEREARGGRGGGGPVPGCDTLLGAGCWLGRNTWGCSRARVRSVQDSAGLRRPPVRDLGTVGTRASTKGWLRFLHNHGEGHY